MPRLRTFYLILFWEFGEKSPPELLRNLSIFQNVGIVGLLRCIMPPSLLRSYISAFPRLRSLVIDDFMEEELDLLPTQTEPHSPSIETLRISRSEEPGRMSSWFASTNTKNTLRCLHLDSRGLSRDALKGFLLEVSQTLVELDLKLRFTRCWSWPMPVVDEGKSAFSLSPFMSLPLSTIYHHIPQSPSISVTPLAYSPSLSDPRTPVI